MLIDYIRNLNFAKALFIIGCVLITVWPALYNQYPLVTSDTGTYIGTFIPKDRPLGYHLFLFASSLKLSLWFTIFTQGIIEVWLFHEIGLLIFKERYNYYILGAMVIFASIFTAMPWYTSQLTPDCFTSFYLLSLILYFFKKDYSKFSKIFIPFLLILSGLVHTSHLLIGFSLSVIIIFYSFFVKKTTYLKTAIRNLTFCIISFIIIGLSNVRAGSGFCLSPVSHMFFITRMAEDGILDNYLDDVCPIDSNATSLCAFKGKLGDRQWDMMWNDQFPHSKLGWVEVKKDYSHVIMQTFLKPKLLVRHGVVFVTGGLEELGNLYIGDGLDQSYGDASSPYGNINNHYYSELKAFRSSLQNHQLLPIKEISIVIYIFSFGTILLSLLVASKFKMLNSEDGKYLKNIFLFIGMFIFLNAFISAEFSTILGRYNARVFWVLPFFCFLTLIANFGKFTSKKDQIKELI